MPNLTDLQAELNALACTERAAALQRFFKTGPGGYAQGDRFLGIPVPKQRKLLGQYTAPGTLALLPLADIFTLLQTDIHEYRFCALQLLVRRYQTSDAAQQHAVFQAYFDNTAYINNWDLVDSSAPHIAGHYLLTRDVAPLYTLAQSASLWERRIAIVATLAHIRQGQFAPTLSIAAQLLEDTQDLIHKASGWMLREVGKRDSAPLHAFLRSHAATMPRTMLRYAVERLPAVQAREFMAMRATLSAKKSRVVR